MVSAVAQNLIHMLGSLCRAIRICVYLALDSIARFRPVSRGNVVIVLRLDAIGDFFIWMQSGAVEISRYARQDRGRSVLLANSAWAEYAASTGLWDQVIGVQPTRLMRNPAYRLRLMWRVRGLGARLLIQPRSARVFLQEDCIARVAGTAHRVGNSGTHLNITPLLMKVGDRFYDRLIEVNRQRDKHEMTRNEEFVRGLTGGNSTRFDFPVPSGEPSDRPIVVVLGAGQTGRVWPLEKLAQLLRQVRREYALVRILVLGTSSDKEAAERLQDLAEIEIENQVGATGVGEYVAAIAGARMVICNDTSAYHIAMAFGRRVLCFLGGGHFGWFAPYPPSYSRNAIVLSAPMECFWCNWECRYPREAGGAFRCVASIPVETAWRSVSLLMGEEEAC